MDEPLLMLRYLPVECRFPMTIARWLAQGDTPGV